MKHINFMAALLLICFLPACAGPDSAADSSNASNSYENLTKAASSETTYEDGWTIVSKMQNGDRIYWFFAPDRDNVSPAMFKKTIFNKEKSKQGFEVVSECDAPIQVCDELMRKFKTLSEKYK